MVDISLVQDREDLTALCIDPGRHERILAAFAKRVTADRLQRRDGHHGQAA
jgi:hypothetical protein